MKRGEREKRMEKSALVVIDLQNDITKNYRDIIDGVNEAMNAEGDVYSNEAMFRALASSPSREPASVLRHMLDDVSVHVNGNTASDDMTILCVRYFGGKR